MKKITIFIVLLFIILGPIFSQVVTQSNTAENGVFSMELSSGFKYLEGTTDEIVYDTVDETDYTLSKLLWNQNVMFFGGDVSISMFDILLIGGSLWSSVELGEGTMDNYDWLGYYSPYDETGHDPSEWTHLSHSTTKMEIQQYDAYVGLQIPNIFGFISLSGKFGIQREELNWRDSLQYSIYSSGGDEEGFRDSKTDYDDIPAIHYNASLTIPYWSLGMTFIIKAVSLNVYGEYSDTAKVTGTDIHIIRGLEFVDSYENVTYYAAGGELSWQINKSVFVSFGGKYSLIPEEAIGDTVIYDGTETETYEADAGFRKEEWEIVWAIGILY